MNIEQIGVHDPRLKKICAVMQELRPHLDPEAFEDTYKRMELRDGYRLSAVFEDGECRAVAGYRVQEMLAHGRFLYVDDLVTADAWRSKGYGKALLEHLAEIARRERCASVQLDSGTQRTDAHRFYEREGFTKTSFHFRRGGESY